MRPSAEMRSRRVCSAGLVDKELIGMRPGLRTTPLRDWQVRNAGFSELRKLK